METVVWKKNQRRLQMRWGDDLKKRRFALETQRRTDTDGKTWGKPTFKVGRLKKAEEEEAGNFQFTYNGLALTIIHDICRHIYKIWTKYKITQRPSSLSSKLTHPQFEVILDIHTRLWLPAEYGTWPLKIEGKRLYCIFFSVFTWISLQYL